MKVTINQSSGCPKRTFAKCLQKILSGLIWGATVREYNAGSDDLVEEDDGDEKSGDINEEAEDIDEDEGFREDESGLED